MNESIKMNILEAEFEAVEEQGKQMYVVVVRRQLRKTPMENGCKLNLLKAEKHIKIEDKRYSVKQIGRKIEREKKR